jgi:hypothetical protein
MPSITPNQTPFLQAFANELWDFLQLIQDVDPKCLPPNVPLTHNLLARNLPPKRYSRHTLDQTLEGVKFDNLDEQEWTVCENTLHLLQALHPAITPTTWNSTLGHAYFRVRTILELIEVIEPIEIPEGE